MKKKVLFFGYPNIARETPNNFARNDHFQIWDQITGRIFRYL